MKEHADGERSLTETAVDAIIQLIIRNELQPGSRLPTEVQMAEQLNIGRSTLREATRQLVTRNILEIRQGSGTYVSAKRGIPEDPLGLTFMKDADRTAMELFDVRLLLEPRSAALAAERADEAQIAELDALCSEVERRIEAGESYFEADSAFHTGIARTGGNLVLANLLHVLTASIYMTTLSSSDRYRPDTYVQHRTILNAIARHNAQRAADAMRAHLELSRTYFADRLAASAAGAGTKSEITEE